MRLAAAGALLGCPLLLACTTALARGERFYREGDRLAALEAWRAIPEKNSEHSASLQWIAEVEEEFQQLVVRHKKRALYFEGKGRIAESILDYRLALRLQPGDAETLEHVQKLARVMAAKKAQGKADYREALSAGDLASARRELDQLRELDPFDPEIESEVRGFDDALRTEMDTQLAAGQRGFAAGNYSAAREAFRAVLALDPDNESARGYLSYIATIQREARRSGKAPAAFDAGGAFASDAEIRAEGFYRNALAAERASDLYAAIRHDLRALRANADHEEAREHLAATRKRLSSQVVPLIEAGRNAFRDEDLQSALDLWRRALLVDPSNERAKAYVGRAERQLENLERLRSDPDVATPHG